MISTKNERGLLGRSLIDAREHLKPSRNRILMYSACEDAANETSRVEAAGGKLIPKKQQYQKYIDIRSILLISMKIVLLYIPVNTNLT